MSHTTLGPGLAAELGYRRERLAADVAAARRATRVGRGTADATGLRGWWARRRAAAQRGPGDLDLAA